MRPAFSKTKMYYKYGDGSEYVTPDRQPAALARALPSLYFYFQLMRGPFRWLRDRALQGQCDDTAWIYGSSWVGDIVEDCGCRIHIQGMENLKGLDAPCVFAANHMSTLETFLLPALLHPAGRLTFVVKKSLVQMPLFSPIMRSRDPVAVERKNPREDLAVMLEESSKKFSAGLSLVVFPQSTRSLFFSRRHFNSIGVKLALRNSIPIVPIALKTDAWGQGKYIRDLGKISPRLPVRIKIGAPMTIAGNGKNEHALICDFLESTIADWQKTDGVNQ